jgi:UDP-glucuronate decarboxylase
MTEGLVRMMNAPAEFTGPVNLGNPGEFTIFELAEKIIDLTGSKSQIIFKELPQDDPLQRKPSIKLAKEKLGWEPEVGLEEGLKQTIHHFESVVANSNIAG